MPVRQPLLLPSGPSAVQSALASNAGLFDNVIKVSSRRTGWLPHLTHGRPQHAPESLRARLFRLSHNLAPIGVGKAGKNMITEVDNDLSARIEYLRLMEAINGCTFSFMDESR